MTELSELGERSGTVGAVVVVHGFNDYLPDCLDALEAQCDTVVVIDNLAERSIAELVAPRSVQFHVNDRPRSFAENMNAGVALLDTGYVALVNPDAVADPACIGSLASFLSDQPTAGIVAPQLRWPDGTPQPTGRSFPTVGATVMRRTPLRRFWRPTDRQRRHYRLDRTDASDPWAADWLLGAFLFLRRDDFVLFGGFDERYRMYVEDMDLCARLERAGRGRWVVPGAGAVHEYQAEIDRRFTSRRNWWHAKGMLRFLRLHPAMILGARSRTAKASS